MKLAITVWGNRISPVFDSAHTLMVVEIENKKISRPFYTAFDPQFPADLINILKKNQAGILVCGAISKAPEDLISEQHIRLISFVTGNARQFLDSFARGLTVGRKHMMPGFNHRCLNAY